MLTHTVISPSFYTFYIMSSWSLRHLWSQKKKGLRTWIYHQQFFSVSRDGNHVTPRIRAFAPQLWVLLRPAQTPNASCMEGWTAEQLVVAPLLVVPLGWSCWCPRPGPLALGLPGWGNFCTICHEFSWCSSWTVAWHRWKQRKPGTPRFFWEEDGGKDPRLVFYMFLAVKTKPDNPTSTPSKFGQHRQLDWGSTCFELPKRTQPVLIGSPLFWGYTLGFWTYGMFESGIYSYPHECCLDIWQIPHWVIEDIDGLSQPYTCSVALNDKFMLIRFC